MNRSKRPAFLFAVFLACTLAASAQTAPLRPRILGISHVGFFVSDLPKALDFWHGLLGYDELYDLRNPDGTVHIAFIKINDHQHVELFNQQPLTDSGHLNHIAFTVSNAEQMRRYLASRGVTVDSKVSNGKIGDLNFEIKDPDGNLIEFVEPQPDGMEARNAGKFLPATRISDSIYHLGFLVGSSEKSIKFYGEVLGFHEFWRGSSNGTQLSWIDMQVPDGNDYVEFMLYRDLPAPDKRGGQEHISLLVPDVAKSIATLEARPAFESYGKPIAPHTGVNGKRQVNLFDPDGTRAELMESDTANGKPVPPSTAPPPR
ncbi:VOC family protein [Tunturibacter empetritectus]|uniref:VOC family protein n=1 Tax=Tunturiibacter empetritectus TaxID=3069691 RepID=A0AAU7ZIF2_9BACT